MYDDFYTCIRISCVNLTCYAFARNFMRVIWPHVWLRCRHAHEENMYNALAHVHVCARACEMTLWRFSGYHYSLNVHVWHAWLRWYIHLLPWCIHSLIPNTHNYHIDKTLTIELLESTCKYAHVCWMHAQLTNAHNHVMHRLRWPSLPTNKYMHDTYIHNPPMHA
jgi:hypothetical protein